MDGKFRNRRETRSRRIDSKSGSIVNKETVMAAVLGLTAVFVGGCASRYGHLIANDEKDMVGSHEAGAATWNPLVDTSVAKLLGRCPPVNETLLANHPQPAANMFGQTPAAMVSHTVDPSGQVVLNDPQGTATAEQCGPLVTGPARVCFVGIENKSAEELVDFKDQLYERIDSQINSGQSFRSISRRLVDAALIETRLRPDSLFLPANRGAFSAALGRQGTPVDYLLYATITSGTTDRNKSTQRDYLLTLEMVNLHSGDYIKESAKIRKGYHKTRAGKWWNFGIFDQADG